MPGLRRILPRPRRAVCAQRRPGRAAWVCRDRAGAERRHGRGGRRARHRALPGTNAPAGRELPVVTCGPGAGHWTLVPLSCGCGSRPTEATTPVAAPGPLVRTGERVPVTSKGSATRAPTPGTVRKRAAPARHAACRGTCSAIARSRSARSSSQAVSRRSPLARTVVEACGRPPSGSSRRRSRCSQSLTSSRRRADAAGAPTR